MRTFTVALVGADGAGKSTITRRLSATLPMPVKHLYMGDNPESANKLLPTTRLLYARTKARGARPAGGPPDPEGKARARPVRGLPRLAKSAKGTLRLANQVADEWYRQGLAWRYRRQGHIVLFDRHFFADYYAHDVAPPPGRRRTLGRRLHGLLLRRLYPLPDLVVCLDAPAEVLLARKGEGTLELLEQRRREYFAIEPHVRAFEVVDAARPVDEVARDVASLIEAFAAKGAAEAPRS